MNQCSGINAINVYSSNILDGIDGLPVTVGVYLLSLANVVGALLGPLVQKYVSIRTMIIVGNFFIAGFNGAVILFSELNYPIMILVSMILMIATY